MDRETAKQIFQALEDNGVIAYHREHYSGRGMYGDTTDAIVTDDEQGSGIVYWAAGQTGIALHEIERFRTDSMGLGTVVY